MNNKKICTRCNNEKYIIEFSKQRNNTDGLRNYCKSCDRSIRIENNRTINGLINRLYSGQIQRSKTRGHSPPDYTKKWFSNWLLTNYEFIELYDNWVKSDYQKNLRPSIDRISDKEGYTKKNIQLMNWIDHKNKTYNDLMSGRLTHGLKLNKPVIQLTIDNVFIKEHSSTREAARYSGINQASISRVCRGSQIRAGRFKFKFEI